MDEVIWIEVLARHQREVAARQRVGYPEIAIGRAYDNDIVLDDPHVAPHHLRLRLDDDGYWIAQDLGSLNGTWVDGVRREHIRLDNATTLLIGQTGIRLRSSAYPVPPEQPLLRAKPDWWLALACMVALLGLVVLQLWLNETGETKLIAYLTPPLELAVVAAGWAALWSVLSRTFAGRARYSRHLLIASVGLLALVAYEPLAQIGAFALSLPALAAYDFIALWLVLAAACFAHLLAISHARPALKAVLTLLLAGLGISIHFLSISDVRSRTNQPTTALLQSLEPPVLRLTTPQPQNAFFAVAAGLKKALDESRAQEPEDED
ncbi:MAG: FHA domain-containing protein [Burkholderiaceae bacterium]|nr:FHA domain-containing protein [Burkholderiaceae bacterium]